MIQLFLCDTSYCLYQVGYSSKLYRKLFRPPTKITRDEKKLMGKNFYWKSIFDFHSYIIWMLFNSQYLQF